jgi:hypothetical protein
MRGGVRDGMRYSTPESGGDHVLLTGALYEWYELVPVTYPGGIDAAKKPGKNPDALIGIPNPNPA